MTLKKNDYLYRREMKNDYLYRREMKSEIESAFIYDKLLSTVFKIKLDGMYDVNLATTGIIRPTMSRLRILIREEASDRTFTTI